MAQTNQTIANFYDRALAREFSRDFLARVLNISFPGGAAFTEDDLIYARSAKVPARGITNIPAKYMGLPFNLAGAMTYPGSESYQLEFYCDATSSLRNKFLEESRRIFDDATSTGDYNITGRGSNLTLLQLDKNLDPVATYKLIGASVREVGDINYLIAEGVGAPVNFSVTLSYHFFEETGVV